MNEPTDEEINKTIAEYMCKDIPWLTGEFVRSYANRYARYTDSLDALVPVVEKLKGIEFTTIFNYDHKTSRWEAMMMDNTEDQNLYGQTIDKSPSRALARAAYEVIKGKIDE